MLQTIDSEENIDFQVEEYLKVGVNVISHKTKLAKRVYILILITNFFILFFDYLEENHEIKQSINSFLLDYMALVVIMGVILLFLIFFLPERNNLSIIFFLFVWVIWITYFSCIFSLILKYWPQSNLSYSVFFVHHLIVTIFVFFREVFDMKILFLNLILWSIGIFFVAIQKFWNFPNISYIFIFGIEYLVVNCLYFILIHYFAQYHQKKFWRRRKCFTFFLIFIISNLSGISILLVLIYIAYVLIMNKFSKKQRPSIQINNIDIQVFLKTKK